ncbi:unnamed protein product [Ilex paraguariensis]|uniref:Cytochrome P450 n=1 Tax=Ilex paraguariensis TaxID=185542 RepID=A0ABC8V076_9AQUA
MALEYFGEETPPGSIGFPLIGNLFDIGSKPYESLAKLSRKHGPLMTIRLGCVTSKPEMARENFQKNEEACSSRKIPDAITVLEHYDLAILWMSAAEEWRLIRKALNIYLTHPQKLESLHGLLRDKVVKQMLQFVNQASQNGEAAEIRKLAFTTALNQMSNT